MGFLQDVKDKLKRLAQTPINNQKIIRFVNSPINQLPQQANEKFLGGITRLPLNIASALVPKFRPQIQNFANRIAPQTEPTNKWGKVGAAQGNIQKGISEFVPSMLIPGVGQVKYLDKASPLIKLVGYSGIRGLENAGFGEVQRLGEQGRFSTPKEIAGDIGTGALFNVAMSPRLTAKAGKELIGNVREISANKPRLGFSRGFAKFPMKDDGLDALSNEAKRYKSAEEFAANKPKSKGVDSVGRDIPDWKDQIVYHSTDTKNADNIAKNGWKVSGKDDQFGYYGHAISTTPNVEYTRQFGDKLTINKVDPTANILNLNDEKDFAKWLKITDNGTLSPDKFRERAIANGIDGVYDPGAGDLFIYNDKKLKNISIQDNKTFDPKDVWNKSQPLSTPPTQGGRVEINNFEDNGVKWTGLNAPKVEGKSFDEVQNFLKQRDLSPSEIDSARTLIRQGRTEFHSQTENPEKVIKAYNDFVSPTQEGEATARSATKLSPKTLVQDNPNIPNQGQPLALERTQPTSPQVQTPTELSQKSSSQIQSTPLLTSSQEQLLLNSGRPTNKKEAISIFKKTGKAVGYKNIQKTNEKPFIFSESNGQSRDIKVRVLDGDGKEIPVKINALNDVSPETIKDISGLDANFKSIYRNFEKAFGDKFADIKRRILDPFDAAKGAMIREQEQLANGLNENIVKKLGINKGSKESALVQQFGEGKITLEELKKATPKWQNIVEADKWFRGEYDRILSEVNAVRAKIYPNNPEKQIPRRNDYYRHFQELTGFEGLRNLFDSPAGIPTELSGISPNTKPKSKFLSFAQKRLGLETKDDAVGGFINYLRSSTYAKYIDPQISVFRNLAEEIQNIARNSDDPKVGSRLNQYITDFANDLSGKTNPGDRWIQDVIGRKAFGVLNWLNSRVKANVILGNLSSSVAQAGNTPQMMAKAGYKNWAKGFVDFFNPNNKVIDSSDFIKERYSNSIFDQFDNKLLDQPKKLAIFITSSMDELATKIGWNGFYRQALEKGVSNPIKYADDLTRAMVGGRGIGEVPLIQKAKVTQLVAPFQLEVQNLMHVLGSELKNKEYGVLIKYVIAAYAFNKVAEQIRGSGVTFDPMQAIVDSVKAYREEDNKGIGLMRAGGRLGGEVLSNTMGGQQIASLYPENGIKIGGETVTRKELFGKKDPTRFGQGLIASGIQNPIYKILPGFGGAQLEKTVGGLQSYSKGYVENKGGQVQYPIDKNPINLIKSAAFGKYATGQAREFFDKGSTALSDKQSEIFKKIGDKANYYKSALAQREKDKIVEDYKKGKQVKSTDPEVQLEIDKIDFKNSGKKSGIIGDKYFYLQKDGDVGYYTKPEFESKVRTQKLELLYENKNYKEWAKVADEQLKSLKEEYKDANELDQLELENKIIDLEQKIEKYKGYGGFTKGKKGKKISLSKLNSIKVKANVSKAKIPYSKPTKFSVQAPVIKQTFAPKRTYKFGKVKKV